MATIAPSTAAPRGLRKDEGIGLAVAVALHAAVLAALLFTPSRREVVTPPQRIEVTIADQSAETSTSPDPFRQASPDRGPTLGEPAPPPAAEPEPAPEPAPAPPPPVPQPAPRVVEPAPRPVAKPAPAPKPVPRPVPKPVVKAPAPKPVAKAPPPKPAPRAANPIDRIVARTPPAKSAPAKSAPAKAPAAKAPAAKAPAKAGAAPGKAATPPRKAGSSAFDDAFKAGTPGASAQSRDEGKPASAYSNTERASFAGALLRQVKPKWQGRVPEGVGTDKLVTIISVELKPDGSLARRPTVVRQEGIDDSNRAQAARHAEEAVRAVELAAPFNLPADDYEGWKKLPPLRFKKAL